MANLTVTIRLLSPVILSSFGEDTNLTGTLDYVPGTSILGMFATKYIKQARLEEPHSDDNFYSWYLNGDLIFTNAYLSVKDEYGELNLLPTPLCIKKLKATGEVVNTFLKSPDEQVISLAPYSHIQGNIIKTKEAEKRISFHHARERLTGHTKDDAIFNYEALLPGQIFKGKISGDPEILKVFKETFRGKFFGRLGKSRNTEYGRVEIELSEEESSTIDEKNLEEQERITITFVSPCVLLNQNGFPEPTLYRLESYLENIWRKDSFKIENASLKRTTVENYFAVWKMKRPLKTAIQAGSTIMICFKEDMPYEEIKKGLWRLEKQGIGERRGEGFGQVKINIATVEVYSEKETRPYFKKPTGDPPKEVSNIFKSVLQTRLREELRFQAYQETDSFDSLPSSSLLGKLRLMLFNSQDCQQFKVMLDELRNKAREQLNDCSRKGGTLNYILYEHIKNFNVKDAVESICRRNASYEKLAKIANFKVEQEKEFLLELWKMYFDTLFKQLRKKERSSRKEADVND